MIDLPAYFRRIGHAAPVRANLATLQSLHLQHACAIPFENLSTLIREPIPLDVEALQAKLVERRRGGYCFEQNKLFMAVLREIGFAVVPLAARVVWNQPAGAVSPRTHMVLSVHVDEEDYICDVGFGGATLTAPLRFAGGLTQNTPHEKFRILSDSDDHELQVQIQGAWRPMYRFDLQPQQAVDYEVANHFVATHPESRFLTELMVGRPFDGGRYALRNNCLTTYRNTGEPERQQLATADAIKRSLTEHFGIHLPDAAMVDPVISRIAAERYTAG